MRYKMRREPRFSILAFVIFANLIYGPSSTFARCNNIDLTKIATFQAANNVDGAIIADFNNDDRLDIITLGRDVNEDSISIALGQGDGTFATPQTILGPSAGNIQFNSVVGGVTADFNNDGILDLLISHFIPGAYEIFLGQGNGTFISQSRFTVLVDESRNPAKPIIGDINNDGNLDIIAISGPTISRRSGGINIFLGQGDGTFLASTFYDPNPSRIPSGLISTSEIATLTDINADGRLDIVLVTRETVMSQRVRVIFQKPDGSFNFEINNEVATIVPISSTNRFFEFDGDNILDLLIIDSAGNEVSVMFGRSDGTFVPRFSFNPKTTGLISLAAVADNDGDNILDLALFDSGSNTILIYPGLRSGTFRKAPIIEKTLSEIDPIFFSGDFNGDSRADLIAHSKADLDNNLFSIYLTTCQKE
jgi:hypothetical protein